MSTPCKQNNKSSPYFQEFTTEQYPTKTSLNDYILGVSEVLNAAPITFKDKNFEIPELDDLPDGAFTIRESNNSTLNYNVQVNNYRYWQYHRNNGITKIGLLDPESNTTQYNMITIESLLAVADVVNRAYQRMLFSDT